MLRQSRQALNDHTGAETYFEHPLARPDFEKFDHPGDALFVGARHDDAAEAPQHALRPAKHAQQNVSHEVHR